MTKNDLKGAKGSLKQQLKHFKNRMLLQITSIPLLTLRNYCTSNLITWWRSFKHSDLFQIVCERVDDVSKFVAKFEIIECYDTVLLNSHPRCLHHTALSILLTQIPVCHWREQRPFCWESDGGWRKDDVCIRSLAGVSAMTPLVGWQKGHLAHKKKCHLFPKVSLWNKWMKKFQKTEVELELQPRFTWKKTAQLL